MSTYLNTHDVIGVPDATLLTELNEIFPPVSPNPDDSLNKIMYQSGQRSVVEWVAKRLEKDHG
jgi:hypothetical protein